MNSKSNNIIRLEEIALNAFPAITTEFYDGWILRYSNGYTFRGNSVNPIYNSQIELEEKVTYCENKFFEKKLPCVFKMTEAVEPDLDKVLADKGYEIQKSADIMECFDEDMLNKKAGDNVIVDYNMTDKWLDNFLVLNGTTNDVTKETAKNMLKNIANKVFCASIIEDGKMAACGLGVLEDGKVGLYDIRVLDQYRRRGLATNLCQRIIEEGVKQGAKSAYLQVASNNTGAIKLYEGLGFKKDRKSVV